jgi:hypothetical protein
MKELIKIILANLWQKGTVTDQDEAHTLGNV